MLEVKRTFLLDGNIIINNEIIATMRGEVRDIDTKVIVDQTILNQEVYDANKSECRKMYQEFQEKVWELEDAKN